MKHDELLRIMEYSDSELKSCMLEANTYEIDKLRVLCNTLKQWCDSYSDNACERLNKLDEVESPNKFDVEDMEFRMEVAQDFHNRITEFESRLITLGYNTFM